MLALIDGDIICYRCAAVTEGMDEGLAKWQSDELVRRILSDVDATDHTIFLSGEDNFRYAIYPDYKANRRDKPKPSHLELLREHLLANYQTEISHGIEADDSIGIASTRHRADGTDCIVCSIDKDLRQLAGMHYNFVRREISEIGEFEGWQNFYQQILIGDPGDNIPGCPGIGKAKAPRLLSHTEDVLSMYLAVQQAYAKAGIPDDILHRNAKLLYILRREEEEWTPPNAEPEQEAKQ